MGLGIGNCCCAASGCAACCSDTASWSTVAVDVDFTAGTFLFTCPPVPLRAYLYNSGTVGTPVCTDECDYCDWVNTTFFLDVASCTSSVYNCPAAAGTCTLDATEQAIYDLAGVCTTRCLTGNANVSGDFKCCVSSPPFTFNIPMSISIRMKLKIVKVPAEDFCRLVLDLNGVIVDSAGALTCSDGGKNFCSIYISDELTSAVCCGTHTLNLACVTGDYCDPYPSTITVTITCA